jgi:hypothetical protein
MNGSKKNQEINAVGSVLWPSLQYPPFPENIIAYLNIISVFWNKCVVFLEIFKLLTLGILDDA